MTLEESECRGKRRFPSERQAARHAAQRRETTGRSLGHYQCQFCHCYHVGHRPADPLEREP